MPELALGDVVRQRSRWTPSRLALICGPHRLTYADLDRRIDRVAAGLQQVGVGPGDRVLWMGQNCHRVFELLFASARLGATFCPANWRQSQDELVALVDDVDPRVVVWQEEEIGEKLRAVRAQSGTQALWLSEDAVPEAQWSTAVPVDAHDPVLMMHTAAFGGRANGALLSHRALHAQGVLLGLLQGCGPDDVYLNCGPLFHIATMMFSMATLVYGGTNVVVRRVDAEDVCRTVAREGCTGAYLLGPTVEQIVGLNAGGRFDVRSLRTPVTTPPAFAAMTSPDTSPWGRRPGGYGQTETAGLLTFHALGGEHAPELGSHGWPSPLTSLAIVGPDDRELPIGDTGEIVARGPTVMNGYWRRPELTAERQSGGWHHTRDLGRIESDGSLTFIGPMTRIVKSAAENIYPAEVERCLASHPAVAEAAVIGVPDPVWMQAVKAIVVRQPGSAPSPEELIEHCRARIASYKKPKLIEFVDALPRSNGQVDYDALDARFGGGNYPGAHRAHG